VQANNVRFEMFTAANMKNAVSWKVVPCGFCEKRSLLATANAASRLGILYTLKMEAKPSSET
jgi:hypothetical protein